MENPNENFKESTFLKNKEFIKNYYTLFHNYLTNTNVEKMSYKKLDKFINILYNDWPNNMDLHDFVKYRKEYTKCPIYTEYLSRIKKTDIHILPTLSPDEIFKIYSLDKCFEINTRYWCGMKYKIFCIDENTEIKIKKINDIKDLIEIMKICKDEYLSGKNRDEIVIKYSFILSKLFNQIFCNIKSYKNIVFKRYYDNIVYYNSFSFFINEENDGILKRKDPFRNILKHIMKMNPEKVVQEYELDKIFNIFPEMYPNLKYTFYNKDMSVGF